MNFTESIFKAYDIRGVVRLELSAEVAHAVGRGLADLLETPGPVAVGYDMRPASVEYAAAVREGLIQQGRDVIDIGLVTSDMIYFAVGHLDLAGGAMVTASHNPGQYDGIKLCRRGDAPIGEDSGLLQIEEAIKTDSYKAAHQVGTVAQRNIMSDWVKHALGFIKPQSLKGYHIAADAGNGMAGEVLPHLEGKWPLAVEPLYWKLDGTFPNHPANPMIEANNNDLIELIRSKKLDFGLAFDGDGDRAFVVDEKGRVVMAHIMSAMLAKYYLKLNPGANIIYDARNSRLVQDIVRENGGTPIRSRVGHSFIKEAMRQYDAPFGGEFSGHYYFRDNFYADSGLIGALVAVQVINDSGKMLSELVDEYAGRYARSQEENYEVADKAAKIAELKRAYADGKQDEFDGLTVNYANWWFNVRPSNTEPLLRLNVEATTADELSRRLAELEQLLKG